MKKAILVLGDGSTIELDGKFILITETWGSRTLSAVDAYTDGKPDDLDCICDDLSSALDYIRQTYGKKKARRS